MDAVFEIVMQLAQENYPDVAIKMERGSRLREDLNLDSLDRYELLFRLEGNFGITIPDEKALEMLTVGDVCLYIESRL
jgi:acyl carrier protein